jgi:hypothetical protein
MHLNKPSLSRHFADKSLKGYDILQKIFFTPSDFFTPSEKSQAAGAAFIGRLMQRKRDRDPLPGPEVAQAQLASFRESECSSGVEFEKRLGLA